jgi:hypothetical protein
MAIIFLGFFDALDSRLSCEVENFSLFFEGSLKRGVTLVEMFSDLVIGI